MKQLAVLGSTGSIGVSTLEIVADYPDRFRVVALTAGRNLALLEEQILRFKPSSRCGSGPGECTAFTGAHRFTRAPCPLRD